MSSSHLSLRHALAVAILAVAPAAPAAAGSPRIACGDTITASTRLTANLLDCPATGLRIGADGVTLDLGGHSIAGSGDDVGIEVGAHRNVTIAGGTVREFGEGVLVEGGSAIAIHGMTSAGQAHGGITVADAREVSITDNVVRDCIAGIIVSRSDGGLVEGNRVSGSGSGGIPLFGSRLVRVAGNTVTTSRGSAGVGLFDGSSQNEVTANRLSRNAAGVGLDDGSFDNRVAGNALAGNDSGVIVDVGTHDNDVSDNLVADSGFEGIAVVGSDANLVARNRVLRSGALEPAGGIVVIASPDDPTQTSDANELVDNAAIDNRGDGILVGAGQSANLLRGNGADRNSGLGIDAAPGTVDGGGNHAARNGDPLQCVGVVCDA